MRHDPTSAGPRATHISVLSRRPRNYEVYTVRDLDRIAPLRARSVSERNATRAVAAVVPFRVSSYVLEELIDWSCIPDDPIYQATFPQPAMLDPEDFSMMYALVASGASEAELQDAARLVHDRQAAPAGDAGDAGDEPARDTHPFDDRRPHGAYHDERETLRFYPTPGQACPAGCAHCFRWGQLSGDEQSKFVDREAAELLAYVRAHAELTSVRIAGDDPLLVRASLLSRYVEPLLDSGLQRLESIRFDTRALAHWPHRFTTDPDSAELLRLFERIHRSGHHVAIMAHVHHPREMETAEARLALQRLQGTGAVVRSETALLRHVNDAGEVWQAMWREQVRLGVVPHAMCVERDTGPRRYYEVPLARALDIFNEARARQSSLGRTARGPSMSAMPGRVVVDGRATVAGEDVFLLEFLEARDPGWLGQPFFARWDGRAAWLDDLVPAFGDSEFFYEPELREMARRAGGA